MKLRGYQRRAIRQMSWALSEHQRVLWVGPQGCGKTVLVARLVRRMAAAGGRSLVLVHRVELARQMVTQLIAAGLPEEHVGVVMAADEKGHPERIRPDALVQVAGVMTAGRRGLEGSFELVVVDEAHHVAARSYQQLLALYPKALHVGLTATPWRLDGKGLSDHYDLLLEIAGLTELVADGYLSNIRDVYGEVEEKLPSMKEVGVNHGDYNVAQLERRVNQPRFVGSIVSEKQRLAPGFPTVVFCGTVRHARDVVKRFRRAGVTAEVLEGKTPQDKREQMLAALAEGKLEVIATCDVISEGWDMPVCKCVVLARPTLSLTRYLQQVGRASRPSERKAIIIDHSGNVLRHGMPLEEREWSLAGRPRTGRSVKPRYKVCPSCKTIISISYVYCPVPGCGWKFEEAERKDPQETADRLRRIEATKREKAAALITIKRIAARRGEGDEWTAKVFADMFDEVG